MEPNGRHLTLSNSRRHYWVDGALTRGRLQGISRAKHDASSFNSIESLPNHCNNGARGHELDYSGKEGFSLVFRIICGRPEVIFYLGKEIK
jgi:hypothetical protein